VRSFQLYLDNAKKAVQILYRLSRVGLLVQIVTLLETVYTAAGINQLLSAGKERMTLGADFYSDILLGGAGLDHFTASAANGGLLVVGMDSLFHGCHLFLLT